jgi:hypothetical protein
MFGPLVSFLAAPLIAALWVRPSKVFPEKDLEALLARLRQRLYPETIPVLASYWLKTVYARGYEFRSWKKLNGLLKRALGKQVLHDAARQAIREVQEWIEQTVLATGQTPRSLPPRLEPVRSNLNPQRLAAYAARLLNEWLPVEVARLLVKESESAFPQSGGIPVLATARALERLLARERLSPATLEMLLQAELLSPRCVYPADAEILRDIVLSLLGRSAAATPPVMPATLLNVAPGSPLPANYKEAVRHAFLASGLEGEELHVPIAPAQAAAILKGDQVRIGSVVVTMDGRWWESENLQSGEQHSLVYRPKGRLRIDYSADHARLRIPWPEIRMGWPGSVHFEETFEIFGREWRVSHWEEDAERAWLHLEFSRVLPMAEIAAPGDIGLHRLRPASVDMAWAAMESALAASIVQKSREPIEQLRHSDLIPLGRAMFGLAESVMNRRLQKSDVLETQLRAIRYLESQVSSVYGRVPWRIVPAPARATLLKIRPGPALRELFDQVFDALPETLREGARSSPPHAA